MTEVKEKYRLSERLPAPKRRWVMAIVFPVWIATSFLLANAIVIAIFWLLNFFNATALLVNEALLATVVAGVIYSLTLVIAIGVPYVTRGSVASREELGLTRLPSWMDILLTPAAMIVYLIASASLVLATSSLFPQINLTETQDVGFNNISAQWQYILAFATLVIIAPVAEEVVMRGYLYGKLKKYIPLWAAVLVTSALFGIAHGQWNVAIDTFALGIVLCLLREVSGNIWAGILLHMLKNGVAFYFLFVNPSLLNTLGG